MWGHNLFPLVEIGLLICPKPSPPSPPIFYVPELFINFIALEKIETIRPSLNTQSCIKGLLVVWDFCFWAVWAAGPVHKKKLCQIMSNF